MAGRVYENDDNFHVHGMEIVERHCSEGPVVFATMHFGNMESMLKFSEKFPFVTVAKKQRNPYLNRYISENRKHLNITLLEKSKKQAENFLNMQKREKILHFFLTTEIRGQQ